MGGGNGGYCAECASNGGLKATPCAEHPKAASISWKQAQQTVAKVKGDK